MNFTVKHQAEVEAEDKNEAALIYQANWDDGFYTATDCDVEESQKGD